MVRRTRRFGFLLCALTAMLGCSPRDVSTPQARPHSVENKQQNAPKTAGLSIIELERGAVGRERPRSQVEGVPLDQWETLPNSVEGWPETIPDYEPIACGRSGIPRLESLGTGTPYDSLVILEKLEGLLQAVVLETTGLELCAEAEYASECMADVTSGLGIGDAPGGDRKATKAPLRLDPWENKYRLHVVVRQAGQTKRFVGMAAISQLLGPVKTAGHAALLAAIEGLRFQCDEPGTASTRQTSEGFEVVGVPQSLDDMSPCGERLRVLVREDSSMRALARHRLVRREGRCVP